MEIILLRHGKPEVELSGYLSAKQLKQLVYDYAQSGIQDEPTDKLKTSFNNHHVVCSDLVRSIESAKKLNLNTIHVKDALYRELELPHFDKFVLKLPTMYWLILLRVMWLFGFSKNGESLSQAKARSKQAAEELIVLANNNKKVIVVGHGLMNYLIGKSLKRKGWQSSKKAGKRYWEFRAYNKL